MKNTILTKSLFFALLFFTTRAMHAQVYRASTTDALQNNGMEWVEKTLPPSVITFSDYSGEIKIKVAPYSLFAANLQTAMVIQNPSDTLADFTMKLGKDQLTQQQMIAGKSFTSSGLLTFNNITRKISVQCWFLPGIDPREEAGLSVVIRFNPADFGVLMIGETSNDPLIVRVKGGYINRQQYTFR